MSLVQGPKDPVLPSLMYIHAKFMDAPFANIQVARPVYQVGAAAAANMEIYLGS